MIHIRDYPKDYKPNLLPDVFSYDDFEIESDKKKKNVMEITEEEKKTARTTTTTGEVIKPNSFNILTDKIRYQRN